jgi:hypothetical protein
MIEPGLIAVPGSLTWPAEPGFIEQTAPGDTG